MASESLVLTPRLGEPELRKVFAGVTTILALGAAMFGVTIAPLTALEQDALAEPAARMLHGRKKTQAVIEKATDPALLAAAFSTIVLARVRGSGVPIAARQTAPGVVSPSPPAQPSPTVPARPPGPNMGAVDVGNVVLDARAAQAVLDELQRDLLARG